MLYHDEETESFWSQMTGEAVLGPLAGRRLAWIPSEVTTWKRWREAHPDTTVLKPPLPAERYAATARYYDRYRRDDRTWFPTGPREIDPRFARKERVTIAFRDGRPRCYPHPALREGESRDGTWRIVKEGPSVRILDEGGHPVPAMTAYWFAWCAFYEGGSVYEPAGR